MTQSEHYFAVCILDKHNEMVAAECAALTGARPDGDGFASCVSLESVGRAAYVRFGAARLAYALTRAGLLGNISDLQIRAEAFRVEVVLLPGGEAIHGREMMIAAADRIEGDPHLTEPKRRFVVVSREQGFWFGEIIQSQDGGWQRFDDKPLRTSSSLPSRLCRAIVNLAVRPGDQVLNPCCGTGSFLLEAASMGVSVQGLDHNPRMVGMSRNNLAHFGYTVPVAQGEVTEWEETGDLVLANLPYDRNCRTTEMNIREILSSSVRLASRAVFVAEIDLKPWLREAGYSQVVSYKVPKSQRFSRYVHCAQT